MKNHHSTQLLNPNPNRSALFRAYPSKRGFTLIEWMVAITIIFVIAVVVVPAVMKLLVKSQIHQSLRSMERANAQSADPKTQLETTRMEIQDLRAHGPGSNVGVDSNTGRDFNRGPGSNVGPDSAHGPGSNVGPGSNSGRGSNHGLGSAHGPTSNVGSGSHVGRGDVGVKTHPAIHAAK